MSRKLMFELNAHNTGQPGEFFPDDGKLTVSYKLRGESLHIEFPWFGCDDKTPLSSTSFLLQDIFDHLWWIATDVHYDVGYRKTPAYKTASVYLNEHPADTGIFSWDTTALLDYTKTAVDRIISSGDTVNIFRDALRCSKFIVDGFKGYRATGDILKDVVSGFSSDAIAVTFANAVYGCHSVLYEGDVRTWANEFYPAVRVLFDSVGINDVQEFSRYMPRAWVANPIINRMIRGWLSEYILC